MPQTRDFESISAFFVKSTIHDDGSENQRNPDQKSEQKMLKKSGKNNVWIRMKNTMIKFHGFRSSVKINKDQSYEYQ